MNSSDPNEFLLKHGWKRDPKRVVWQWYLPRYPGAFYTLKDAYDTAVGLLKQRIGS